MKRIEVFEVANFEEAGSARWRVQGRAYERINRGEKLIGLLPGGGVVELHVEMITVFRRAIEQLYPVMAGELLLLGDIPTVLSGKIKLLYMESEEQA